MAAALAFGLCLAGCPGDPLFDPLTDTTIAPLEPIVSNPALATGQNAAIALARIARAASTQPSAQSLVYVSLPPGTVPDGGLATIRNTRTGMSLSTAMMAGGFDPVPIEAEAGDSLALDVRVVGGGSEAFGLVVPTTRPPIVVRTDPPPRKRDVPLNATLMVVFSEPIHPASVGSIRLLRAGAPVSGVAVLSADGLRATFEPADLLEPNIEYVISVETGVADLDGDRLEATATADFTTGTGVVLASVATAQAALVIHPAGNLQRTIDFRASLMDDSTVLGDFNIFYPEAGYLIFGRVTCFSIVGDTAAWVAGTVEGAVNQDRIGHEGGWVAVDRGSGPVPDQISLAYPLDQSGTTAQEFCTTTPATDPVYGAIELYDLLSGDVVVNPDGPPPPPTLPSGMSRIASVGTHDGGIKVVNADGSGGRALTTDRDWSPAWSPDGTRLAFDRTRTDGGADIYVMNADGSGVTRLTNSTSLDTDPAWSPDSSRIAFTRDGVLHVMNVNGTGVTPLSAGGGEYNPSWSPDGSKIAVNRWDGSGSFRIWVVNTDGSGAVALTSGPGDDHHPRWAPDGTLIAFARVFDQSGNSGLYVMNADGSGVTRLTLGINGPPTWSPDGTRIAYNLFGLNIVMRDGTGLKTVGSGFEPAWSPTGAMPPAPAPFRSLEMVSGDGQTGDAGSALPESLRVRVVLDDGSPAAGVVVRWNAWGVEGALQPHPSANTSTTGADGIAAVEATLGSSGPARFRAALTDGTGRVPEVVFTATVDPQPAGIQNVSGGGTNGLVLVNAVHEYAVAAVTDQGEPLAGVPVAWTLIGGDGSISPSVDTTGLDPQFGIPVARTTHAIGPTEGPATLTARLVADPAVQMLDTTTAVTAIMRVVCTGFAADSVVVPAGRTVGWSFTARCGRSSARPHNLTFEDGTSGSPQMTFGAVTRRFGGPPRRVRYRCTLHSTDFDGPAGEVGTVIVQ